MPPVTFGPSRFDRGYFIACSLALLAGGVLLLGHYSAANAEQEPSLLPNYLFAALLFVGAFVIWKRSPIGRSWIVIDADGVTLECTHGEPLPDRRTCRWSQIEEFTVEITGDDVADDVLSVMLQNGERLAVPLQTFVGSWKKVMIAIDAQAEVLGYDLVHRNPSSPSRRRHIWTLIKRA